VTLYDLHRAYADLDARDAVSIPAALMDMVAHNGGKPLTCLA
jgi:hypothetical protein